MKSNNYRLILKGCQKIAVSQPSLQSIQGESSKECADSIALEMSSFIGALFKDRDKLSNSAINTMQPLLTVFDIALIHICDLSYFAWKHKSSRSKLIWPNDNLPTRPTPSRVLYILSSNLAQTLQAVRMLLLSGFEGQSRAMIRNFVEIGDLLLAVIVDKDIYMHYITSYEDDRKRLDHWRKHLAPGIIRQRLAKLDKELNLSNITSVPAEEVREDTYKWFSRFTHVDYVAHIMTAYPMHLNRDYMPPIGLLGSIGETTKATFERIILYLWLFTIHLDRVLWEHHNWSKFKGDKNRNWYWYRSNIFQNIVSDNYDMLFGLE